jgi:hypothetical protein
VSNYVGSKTYKLVSTFINRLIGSKHAREQARVGLHTWILPFWAYVCVHVNSFKITYFASTHAVHVPTCKQPNKHLGKVNASGGPERDHVGNQSEG